MSDTDGGVSPTRYSWFFGATASALSGPACAEDNGRAPDGTRVRGLVPTGHPPYDAILVTAAAPRPPAPLLAQLGAGGRLVVPAGESWEQELLQIRRTAEGTVQRSLGRCRFVPLIGAAAWPEETGEGGGGSPLPLGEG